MNPEGGWIRGGVQARTLGLEGGVDCGVPHRLEKGTSANEDAGPSGGWIVRSHLGWRGERNIFLQKCSFKNFERKPERENSKKTIPTVDLGSYNTLNKENKEKERGG